VPILMVRALALCACLATLAATPAQPTSSTPAGAYTVLAGTTSALTMNPSAYDKVPYDPVRDFAAISPRGLDDRETTAG
jgi:hypothetical protein